MAFENVELPPTILLGSAMGPVWDVEVVEYGQGSRYVNVRVNKPRYRFTLRHVVEDGNLFSQVTQFFTALGGPATGFLVDNPLDNSTAMGSTPTATDQSLGTGDGIETVFNMNRVYTQGSSTATRRIYKPKQDILIATPDSPQPTVVYSTSPPSPAADEASVNTDTGVVTFGTAPGSGAITWGGGYYIPVALEGNDLSGIITPDKWHEFSLSLIELLNP